MIPIVRYRPTRESDGEGGFQETYGEPYEFFGLLTMHENVVRVVVDRHEELRVGDVLMIFDEMQIDPAFYAVTGAAQAARGQQRTFELLRRDRPIWPADAEYLCVEGIPLVFNGHFLTVEA